MEAERGHKLPSGLNHCLISSLLRFSPILFSYFQALGFTESDSAGQTNIFAVEPKTYVAGSTADATAAGANSTYGAAAVAGTFAVGAVIAGLLLVKDASTIDLGPTGDFKTLTEYQAQFAAEFKAPAAAPAVADE